MSDGPLVSAVVATYNRANVVATAIESILTQTYKNIELIVVDDGSTDDTPAVLKRYNTSLQVFYQRNGGPGAARNRGIKAAKGDIIAFLDSDDVWLPSKIERQVAVLQRLDESVPCCLCSAHLRFVDRPTLTSFQNALLNPPDPEGLWLNVPEVLTNRFVLFNQMVAVRRSALEKVGGFNERLRFLEDYDLALRLSLLGPFGFIREPLAIWHQGSESSLSTEAHQQMTRLIELEIGIREQLLERPDLDTDHPNLRRQMRAALTKTRRKLRIARLRQSQSWETSAFGYVLGTLERCADAARRRSPWFIEMKTTPLLEGATYSGAAKN